MRARGQPGRHLARRYPRAVCAPHSCKMHMRAVATPAESNSGVLTFTGQVKKFRCLLYPVEVFAHWTMHICRTTRAVWTAGGSLGLAPTPPRTCLPHLPVGIRLDARTHVRTPVPLGRPQAQHPVPHPHRRRRIHAVQRACSSRCVGVRANGTRYRVPGSPPRAACSASTRVSPAHHVHQLLDSCHLRTTATTADVARRPDYVALFDGNNTNTTALVLCHLPLPHGVNAAAAGAHTPTTIEQGVWNGARIEDSPGFQHSTGLDMLLKFHSNAQVCGRPSQLIFDRFHIAPINVVLLLRCLFLLLVCIYIYSTTMAEQRPIVRGLHPDVQVRVPGGHPPQVRTTAATAILTHLHPPPVLLRFT